MAVLVAFATDHGSTKGIAERIAARLTGQGLDVCVLPVDTPAEFDLTGYSAIILGSAIHNGLWLPAASNWARANASAIAPLPCWLFSVSTVGDEESAFPARVAAVIRRARKETAEIGGLRRMLLARGHRNFAGVIEGEHWGRAGRSFMALFRVRKGDHRNWPAIDAWADEIAAKLQAGSSIRPETFGSRVTESKNRGQRATLPAIMHLADYATLAEMQAVPIFAALGMRFTDAGDGWAEITLLAGPGNQNLYGIVHGGAWLLVADSAMGGSLGTVCVPGERIITGQLDFRWLRPLDGDRIVARGTVLRRGRTLSHCTVAMFDAAGRQVGSGSGTYVIQSATA